MKCPLCGRDMQEGGLIIDGVAPGVGAAGAIQQKGAGQAAVYRAADDRRLQYPFAADKGAARLLLPKLQQGGRHFRCDEPSGRRLSPSGPKSGRLV